MCKIIVLWFIIGLIHTLNLFIGNVKFDSVSIAINCLISIFFLIVLKITNFFGKILSTCNIFASHSSHWLTIILVLKYFCITLSFQNTQILKAWTPNIENECILFSGTMALIFRSYFSIFTIVLGQFLKAGK